MLILNEEFTTVEELKDKFISNEKIQELWLGFAGAMGYYLNFGVSEIEPEKLRYSPNYDKNLVQKDIDEKNDLYILRPTIASNKVPLAEYKATMMTPPKVTFSNFKYTLLPKSIKLGEFKTKSFEPKVVSQTSYSNNSDIRYSSTKKIFFTKSTKTIVSTNDKISKSVDLEASITIEPFTFSTEVHFNSENTVGKQDETLVLEKLSDWYTVVNKPKSETSLRILSYETEATIPFTALAAISFDINIIGRLKPSYIAPKDSSWFSNLFLFDYTFGKKYRPANKDIKHHIANRIDPDYYTPFNWDYILSSEDRKNIINAATQTIAFPFSGVLRQISANNMVIEQSISKSLK